MLLYQLIQDYPALSDGSPTRMWLSSIQVISGDGSLAEPTTEFNGTAYPNRIDDCCGVSPLSSLPVGIGKRFRSNSDRRMVG